MKQREIEGWQRAVDVIEDETRDHFEMEIPPLKVGEQWKGPDGREWRQVKISHGATGGRWCYATRAHMVVKDQPVPDPDAPVIVDTIFNGWSPFFAGMLRVPYDGHVKDSLMLVKGSDVSLQTGPTV